MHKLATLWFSYKKCSVKELEEIGERLKPEIFVNDPRVDGYAIINTCIIKLRSRASGP